MKNFLTIFFFLPAEGRLLAKPLPNSGLQPGANVIKLFTAVFY
jgi:hypothetical protein